MSEQNKIDEIKEALAAATPGPWSYDDFSDKEFIIYDHTYFNRHIAEIVSDGVESKEREEANAHLIAKAPEYITYLLQEIERKQKALHEIINTEDLLTGGTAESMRNRAREAL
jgi:transcription termination factor NusB